MLVEYVNGMPVTYFTTCMIITMPYKRQKKYDKVLCFRENGVNTWSVRDDMIHNAYISSDFTQYWRLRWNPNTEYGSFIRVALRPIKEE